MPSLKLSALPVNQKRRRGFGSFFLPQLQKNWNQRDLHAQTTSYLKLANQRAGRGWWKSWLEEASWLGFFNFLSLAYCCCMSFNVWRRSPMACFLWWVGGNGAKRGSHDEPCTKALWHDCENYNTPLILSPTSKSTALKFLNIKSFCISFYVSQEQALSVEMWQTNTT